MPVYARNRQGLRLVPQETVLLICDLQDAFRGHVCFAKVTTAVKRLLQAAKVLGLPIFVSEHQPAVNGPTVAALDVKGAGATIVAKVDFSAFGSIKEHLDDSVKTVIVCGNSATDGACHSPFDLLQAGYAVHLVGDATTHRTLVDFKFIVENAQRAGAVITSVDTAIMAMMGGTSAHPKYAEIMELLKEKLPDTSVSAAALASSLPIAPRGFRPSAPHTVLIVCDMQPAFKDYVAFYEVCVCIQRLLNAANVLDLRAFVSEFQPELNGPTVSELDLAVATPIVVDKGTSFSAYPAIKERLPKHAKTAIVCGNGYTDGVYETTLELLDAGYDVHVPANATTSVTAVDRLVMLEKLKLAGAVVTTVDTAILAMVATSAHPKNAEIVHLLKEKLPATGLVPSL
ncbi:isochorismatase domain-containing protein 2 [Aphelenchoides avenae]|nr:isochorismatase domain-containing protein 2 [Aphelenchus avenae]